MEEILMKYEVIGTHGVDCVAEVALELGVEVQEGTNPEGFVRVNGVGGNEEKFEGTLRGRRLHLEGKGL